MKTTVQVLRKSGYQVMDWKNGRGKTAEIAICPRGASFPRDPFLWRLSSAKMHEDGPFSLFPGYDRYLALAEGKGLVLKWGKDKGHSLALAGPGELCHFSGDETVTGELLEGGVSDLNLIFQRDQVEAKFTILSSFQGPRSVPTAGMVAFIYALAGSVTAFHLADADADPDSGRSEWKLQQGDTLVLEPPGEALWVEPGPEQDHADLMLILVEIKSRGPAGILD